MQKRGTQFSLSRLFIGLSLSATLFSAFHWLGLFGGILFGLALGIASLAWGYLKSDGICNVIGGVLVGLTFIAFAAGTSFVAGTGVRTTSCPIYVVDETGTPVASAKVYMRAVNRFKAVVEDGRTIAQPIDPIPADEVVAVGATDVEGWTSIDFEFDTTFCAGLFEDERWIHMRGLWVQVEAPGYERQTVRVGEALGEHYDEHKLPLPPIRVRLRHSSQR